MVLFFTRKINKKGRGGYLFCLFRRCAPSHIKINIPPTPTKGKEIIKLLSLILYFIILKYNNTFDL